ETLLRVMARICRAYRLARRGVALLAHDGPELYPYIWKVSFVVPFDPDPGNTPASRGLLRPRNPNIVPRAARRPAGFTARTPVQIYCHSPSMCHIRAFVTFVACLLTVHLLRRIIPQRARKKYKPSIRVSDFPEVHPGRRPGQ